MSRAVQTAFAPNRLLTALLVALATSPCVAAESPDAEVLPLLDCVINPSVVADLGSSVPGVLSAVRVDRSDLIAQGQVVAELESSVETVAVELARARAEMDAEINLRRVNAAFGQRQNRRTEDLYQRKVISTNDMDERQTEARLASLQLRQALENQQLAELERRRAEKVLHRRTIQSPISGVVMERFKTIGEYVEDQPVVRVAQLDPLHVEVFVPVQHLGEVREGMQAQVWSEAVPGTHWDAKVSRVDRVADVASGTYGVRLELPNPDYKVPAGLRCQVQFEAAPEAPVVTGAPPVPGIEDVSRESDVSLATSKPLTPLDEAAPLDLSGEYARAARIAAALSNAADDKTAAGTAETAAAVPVATSKAVEPSHAAPEVGAADSEAVVATDRSEPAEPVTTQVTRAASFAASAQDPAPDGQVLPAIEPVAPESLVQATALPNCRWAGPFDEEADAKRQARELRSSGLEAVVEQRSDLVRVGVRVVTDKMPSRDAANALYERMRKAGIRDLYIVTSGKYMDRVALGLYKYERPAQERVEQLAAMGFEAEVRPWLERKTRYFLAVRGVPTTENERLLSALPVPETDAALANGTCEQLASR